MIKCLLRRRELVIKTTHIVILNRHRLNAPLTDLLTIIGRAVPGGSAGAPKGSCLFSRSLGSAFPCPISS
jgi:hypothetical protein